MKNFNILKFLSGIYNHLFSILFSNRISIYNINKKNNLFFLDSKLNNYIDYDYNSLNIDFLLLRSFGRENALSRVQSDPLIQGLKCLNVSADKLVYKTSSKINIQNTKNIILHYNDDDAISKALDIKSYNGCNVICLVSDIYDLDRYVKLSEFVDLFIVPTLAHKSILQPAVWVEVAVVPESFDSIAIPTYGDVVPVSHNNNICWFGYPESFNKSFKYIFSKALSLSKISKDRIGIITKAGFELHKGIKHIPFSEFNFYLDTKNYGYSLLSHFAFDCHINSYIKSPNKLITSIVRGMIPIASNTLNYSDIMTYYNLDSFIFKNGNQLVNLLNNLDIDKDHNSFDFQLISNDIMHRYSAINSAKYFINAINNIN